MSEQALSQDFHTAQIPKRTVKGRIDTPVHGFHSLSQPPAVAIFGGTLRGRILLSPRSGRVTLALQLEHQQGRNGTVPDQLARLLLIQHFQR